MKFGPFAVLFLLPSFAGVPVMAEGVPFVIAPLLETIRGGEILWNPLWPREIPPDAFTPRGGASLVTLRSGGREYRVRRDEENRLLEFPRPLGGPGLSAGLAMVTVEYGGEGEILRLAADSGGEGLWTAEFPPGFFGPGPESLVRVSGNGVFYFVILKDSADGVSETWYDGEGRALAYAKTAVREGRVLSVEMRDETGTSLETYRFESGGRVSFAEKRRAEGSGAGGFAVTGASSAVYYRDRPVYWELDSGDAAPSETAGDTGDTGAAGTDAPARLSLQWDENGFLVRMHGDGADFRCDYVTDERGNWRIRGETVWEEAFGLLVPVSRTETVRDIVYTEPSR
ncbi:MAG: hypothetical protein LBL44_11770 [Treponema sp.]|jgi:hypothetical protein|nr:hypothetical protein [Treponema sp.]